MKRKVLALQRLQTDKNTQQDAATGSGLSLLIC